MSAWQVAFLLLANALVAGACGWVGASLRYSNLSFRVAEMEAALVHYWDRIRKRVRVEPYDEPARSPAHMTDAEILRRAGVNPLEIPTMREDVPHGHGGA